MPIYAYRCATCGHARDLLRKISDPPLPPTCPACGAETFEKQVTAAGFQLKGSGWYVTDFRGGNNGSAGSNGKPAEGASSGEAGGSKSDAKGDAAPASAPAASPAPSPAAGSSVGGSASGGATSGGAGSNS